MFNQNKFNKDKLEHRTETIDVQDLKDWFDGDPKWTVRGLSHKEIALAEERSNRDKTTSQIIQALSGSDNDKAELVKSIIGIDSEMPKDTIKRIEHLILGSVEPEINSDTAIRLSTHFPVVFATLTNKILELTGLGSDVMGKQKSSGKGQTSKTA